MKFKSDIEVEAGLRDSSGAAGTSGQVLSSNGTTVSWINSGGGFANDVQNTVKAGVAINKGQAVYVTGADGTNIIVGLASNATEATSSKTLGLLNATVAINGFADVIQIGKLAGLDTSTAVVGDPVWLGSNGNLIYGLANKPYAPLHLVYIGVVTRVNVNNGEIFINVQNGFELKEIHDVDIVSTPPSNNEILAFEGGSVNLWKNKSISSIGGITGSGTTNYVPKFTGSTALGNSLIYDNGTIVSIGGSSGSGVFNVFSNAASDLSIISRNLNANGLSGYVAQDDTATRFLTVGINNSVGLNAQFGLPGEGIIRASTSATGLALSIVNGNLRILSGAAVERFRIFGSTGNVLIQNGGTFTDNGYKLQIGNAVGTPASVLSALNPILYLDSGSSLNNSIVIKTHAAGNGNSNGSIRFASSPDSLNYSWSGMAGIVNASNSAANLAFYTASSNSQGTAAGASTEQMRIFTTGNITIQNGGTFTDAGFRLDVQGTARVTGQLRLGSTITNGTFTYTLPGATGTLALVGGAGVGTVTSVAALTLGTTGTDLSSTVANGTTTPVITLNVPTASATNRGALSAADWTTFNNKQNALTNPITGTGTTNYLPKFTGSTALGNSLIFDNGSGVGINTTAPNYTTTGRGVIDINGTSQSMLALSVGGVGKSFLFYTGTDLLISNESNGAIKFNTNGSEKVIITSGGNVGIGTTSPSAKLQVYSGASVTDYITFNVGDGSNTLSYIPYVATGDYNSLSYGGGSLLFNTAGSRLTIGTQNGTAIQFGPTNTLISGNVLVGTTTDAGYKLDVAGTSRVTGSLTINSATTPFLYFHSTRTSGQSGYIKDDGNMVFQKTEAGGGFRFLNSSSSVLLSIDSIGNSAFINSVTITPPSNQVGFTVNHSGTNGVTGSKFNAAGSGFTYGAVTATFDACNYGTGIKIVTGLYSTSLGAMQFFNSTTAVGSITCTTTSTAYNTSSDYRLKENVAEIESSISRIKALKPCRFNFISEPKKIVDGFIAHEVQEVIPEAVTGEKDELDYDGSPKYQGIDQSKIVPLLTAALQESISKIEELEKRLSILENK